MKNIEKIEELIKESKEEIIAYRIITETDFCDFVPSPDELTDDVFDDLEELSKDDIIEACTCLEGTSYGSLQEEYLASTMIEIYNLYKGE